MLFPAFQRDEMWQSLSVKETVQSFLLAPAEPMAAFEGRAGK